MKMRNRTAFLILLFLLSANCAGAPALVVAPFDSGVHMGDMANEKISESSGIAASKRNQGVFWTHNDSGNGPFLYAVGRNGEDLGEFRVEGARNRDWEDIAAFKWKGGAYLMIGDVGNNRARQRISRLIVVEEPEISRGRPKNGLVRVAWSIRFQYEDGPRDCESVAVDSAAGEVLLLSKRDEPPVLYSLPLGPASELQTARRLTPVSGIPQPSAADIALDPIYGFYGSQPTGMDISKEGDQAVVLTYKRAYLFSREEGESWKTAFSREPKAIATPLMPQAEGICFGSEGEAIYITSEKRPAPLIMIPRK